MAVSTSSSMGSMSPPSTSTFQESDGIRKSGPILLLSGSKKRGQPAHAVLSERALELYDSEKAYRKKKANRAIVDLSKCFNVSQQNCPKTREPCVCLLMPDECFLFRTENTNETSEWYCNLLSAVISSRALHLGRPVFANEFFECVWDVTICSQQPLKLKKVPAPPNNSTEFANSINICSKLPELAGHKRLCFYPHTIIICKVGIEPAHTGLPKSGIPPFRTMDFVEFSRHFIAQYGQVDKYFLMRIGRTSPMGACEVWIQCESEDTAIEVNRKLQEIIRRETEKKQQALMAIRGQQHHHQAQLHGQQQQQQPLSLSCDQHFSPSCAAYVAPHYSLAPNSPTGTGSPMALGSPSGMGGSGSGRITDKSESFPLVSSGIEQLEPISEDEQLNSTGQTAQTAATALPATGRKKSSSLSQSAREKRLELRERKAKVDTLEEEEQRFQQRQMLIQQQQQQYAGGWTPTKRYLAMKSFRPFDGVAGRLLSMEKADSLVLLGYGPGAEEETEDSGGTLRMIPCDQDGSQAASRSSSSLNLSGANLSSRPAPATVAAAHAAHSSWSRSSSDGQLVQTYVECHASAHNDDEERDSSGTSTSSTEEDSSDYLLNNHFHHPHHHPPPPHHDEEKARKKLQRRKAKNARRQQRQLTSTSGGGDSLDAGTEADQSCSCSESVASSSGQDEQKLAAAAAATQAANAPSDVKKKHSFPAEMLPPQQPHSTNPAAAAAANASEYTLMDSCSSDSFSHLAVPQQQQWDRQNGSGYFPEEFCSYTSDSADSCYSSMANGQLNPRAFSFSSTSDAAPARAHFGPNKLVGPQPHFYQTQPQQHPAAAKWTAAMAHRNYLLQHLQQPPAHFSPPKSYGSGQQMSQHQHLDSSSSSRFSMETSLTTPLEEEDERQVTFADQDQHGQALTNATAQQSAADADDSLRKRAFSLGSKSWLTKPFSKLSSSSGHGAPSSARQQRSSYGGGASRSGSSSLVGSIHADLCSVQEQTSQIQLSHEHRLGSAPSFASSTAAGPVTAVQDHQHARSDSIGSNHSAAVSLPGLSHRLRKKQPSEEHLKNEDLVELEFLPNKLPFSNRSSQCVAITPTDNSLRGRTSSYDEQPYNNNGYMAAPGYFGGPQRKMSHQCGNHHAGGGGVSAAAPRGRGSACSLNYTIGGGSATSGSTTTAAQQQQQQQQRLRPSEFFIRSIQQQQREQQKQKQRHRLKNDFPLQEVQCFIAPDEREKIDAMTSRDSLSMRSQRSGSGSCSQPFETIEEGTTSVQVSQQQQKQERAVKRQRTQSRLSSRSVHSTSSGSPESQLPTGSSNNNNNNNDDDYVLGEVKPKGATALTA